MSKNLNIRQKINLSSRQPELVVLQKHGLVSDNGNITALGRRIQGDLIFNGGNGDMGELLEAVLNVYRAEKAVQNVLDEANTPADADEADEEETEN